MATRELVPRIKPTFCILLLAGMALAACLHAIGIPPLHTPEISLMLRGGYTNEEVLQEVARRHVLDPLDAASEKTLTEAGADARLIAALKSGQYTVSAAASEAVKVEEQATAERVEADREAGSDRLLAHQREQAEAAISRKVANLLRGKLVIWKDGRLQRYDDNVLTTKKVFAFYYAAAGSPPCQQFTPWLLQFYQQFAPTQPQFEIVLISKDRSAEEMQQHMTGMPWPALQFDREAQEPQVMGYAGPEVPCLVLVDGAGGVLADTYAGTKRLGPRHVIEDLARRAGVRIEESAPNPSQGEAAATPAPTAAPRRKSVSLAGALQ